ncbi:Leucine-rich repeat-containing protein 4B [Holothuria leucospilota]|uniref:Leucine-rich repeat-containing protein 4B n=1 Tax=Holothuria leucospilota TaxID=206669 RepID=A0A9Q1HI57_HOLLE|nr:Leucine-rich repeat-containing protein 4B [Holothuria leucospilota]
MQLREIPSDVPLDTQALLLGSNLIHYVSLESFLEVTGLIELHLERNLIGFVPSKAFHPLIKLKFLDLKYNRIKVVPRLAFSGLSNLERLDLAGNMISSIHAESFTFTPNVQILNLYDNPLKDLPDLLFQSSPHMMSLNIGKCSMESLTRSIFQGLHNLTTLVLSENENLDAIQDYVFTDLTNLEKLMLDHGGLKRLTSRAFSGLYNLKELRLDHNRLAHTLYLHIFEDSSEIEILRLDGNTFSSLHYNVIVSLKNLEWLQLDDNRWRCDCGLLGMRAFWSQRRPPMLTSPGIRCSHPEKYRDLDLWNIPISSIVESCLRSIERNVQFKEVELGSTVVLECSLSQKNDSYLAWFSSNGAYIPEDTFEGNNSRYQFDSDGALTITTVTEVDIGPFICSVTYPDGATALRAVMLTPMETGEASSTMTYVLIIVSFTILMILIFVLLLVVILQRNRKLDVTNPQRPASYNPLTILTMRTRRRIEQAYAYAYADVQRQREPKEIDAYAISASITEEKFENSHVQTDSSGTKQVPSYGTLSLGDRLSSITNSMEKYRLQGSASDPCDAYAYVSPNRINRQRILKNEIEKDSQQSGETIATALEINQTADTNDLENRESNAYIEILD